MRRFGSMMVAALAVLLMTLPQTAQADLGDVLGEIEWGDSRQQVLEKLRAEKLNELREDSRIRHDQAAMQRARQGVLDRMRRIEDTYTELRDNSSDYEVSVIAGEFTPNNGEAFLRVRDDAAQRYYFFIDGAFYKLVVAYDQSQVRNMGFQAFLEQVSQRYGSPDSTQSGKAMGEEGVVQAIWEDGESQLRINDRRDFFGTFTMVFSDLNKLETLQARNPDAGGGQDHTEVSSRVRALTQPSDGGRGDVVDDLIGSMEEVDLPESPSERAAREAAEEEASKPKPSQPARTQRRSEPSRTTSSPSTSTSSSSSDDDDDDDDLVIY